MDTLLEKDGLGTAQRAWSPEAFSRELPRAAADLRRRFRPETGGFAGLPEEQGDCAVLYLLEYARRAEDGQAGDTAEAALDRWDGRESALLAYACLESYAQTGRPARRAAACGILDRAVEGLRLPGGAFRREGDGAASVLWNAQLIAALAKACRVLGEESYLRAAQASRLFLKTRLTQSNGRLWRLWQDRTPMEEGRLADYGFYVWALTELYETDFSVSCLREAEGLADRMADVFRDPQGKFWDVDGGGGGAAGLALARLARLTALGRYRRMAREQAALQTAGEAPDGLALLGMAEELHPRWALVCAFAGTVPLWLAHVGEAYRLAVLAKTRDSSRGLANAVPYTRGLPVPEAGERLYLCREGVCEIAAEDLSQLRRRLCREGAPA